MDDAIRWLERRLLSAEGDLALAREYRRALERQGDAAQAGRMLDALEGALCVRAATGVQADPTIDPAPRWERVAVGGRAPLLAPPGPRGGGPLTVRWRARGRARWASATRVLLELPDRTLEARCARTGRALWSVAAMGPGHPRGLDLHDTERTTILGWAAAPWGAVALTARHEARLARVRRSSASWRPRETEREVLERGPASVEVTLQVLVAPGGAWSDEPPQELVERAAGHEALAEGDLALEGWDDDLLALALDGEAPRFCVRWRDPAQDWAVFEVGQGADGAAWLGPAPWSAAGDEDPVGREAPAAHPRPRLDLARRQVERPGAPPLALPPPSAADLAADPAAVAALVLDEALLVRARDPQGLDALWASRGDEPLTRLALPDELEPLLRDLELRFWDEGALEPLDGPARAAVLLPAGDLLLLQAGDALVALGQAQAP